MRYLNDAEFHQTFGRPTMPLVSPDPVAIKLLRIAIEAVPRDHLKGFAVIDDVAEAIRTAEVRRADGGLFEHYLVRTTTANVFLVFVWERSGSRFMGYHVLDLNEKYGLTMQSN